MKKTLISTSLATALIGTPLFAKTTIFDSLGNNIWKPNFGNPSGNGIFYGSTKTQSQLTPFTSTKIEFTSTTTPPPCK